LSAFAQQLNAHKQDATTLVNLKGEVLARREPAFAPKWDFLPALGRGPWSDRQLAGRRFQMLK
jgi:hypothetical protein